MAHHHLKWFEFLSLTSEPWTPIFHNLDTDVNELGAQRDNFKKQKKYQIATIQSQINDLESQRNYTSEQIKILEFKQDNVQSIKILKPPTNSPGPIKPKKKLIVILATFIGIFMMVCLSFFLEYISKNKVQKPSVGWARYLNKSWS